MAVHLQHPFFPFESRRNSDHDQLTAARFLIRVSTSKPHDNPAAPEGQRLVIFLPYRCKNQGPEGLNSLDWGQNIMFSDFKCYVLSICQSTNVPMYPSGQPHGKPGVQNLPLVHIKAQAIRSPLHGSTCSSSTPVHTGAAHGAQAGRSVGPAKPSLDPFLFSLLVLFILSGKSLLLSNHPGHKVTMQNAFAAYSSGLRW